MKPSMGNSFQLTDQQLALVEAPVNSHIYLEGMAGSGKTTAAVERMKMLVQSGIPSQSILILVPQRSLGIPYRIAALSPEFNGGGEISILTLGGLAQRMTSLFWPMLSANVGFKDPARPPQFLTLETSQYYLAQVIDPLLQKGYFESITIDTNRIYSQVLDNLNKSAIVGFNLEEIAPRLKSAWSGPSKQALIYDQVQDCALQFRQFCLANNLLDYSLQFELFARHLWPSALCQNYLKSTYQHLIYDNVEEDVPVAHEIIRSWLPNFKSALAILDSEGGFRTFMGADSRSAAALQSDFPNHVIFTDSLVQSEPLHDFEKQLFFAISQHLSRKSENSQQELAFSIHSFRFFPQALSWTAAEIERLITKENISPQQIVILTPFLSDSLRFSLGHELEQHGVPFTTFRPSRSLNEEPVIRAMLTLAKLAHPAWNLKPTPFDVRYSLMQIIPEADLIRADLLSRILFSSKNSDLKNGAFSGIRPEMQERITYRVGNKFDKLVEWLIQSQANETEELDTFLSRIFGEILSQSDFAFHQDFQAASVAYRLIESCHKFRSAVRMNSPLSNLDISKEYVQMVEQGVISAQYLSNWQEQLDTPGVLISPAFTYLMSNRPSTYQFWLDIGSSGWWVRLDQPLTQPYVLNRNWDQSQKWTSRNELEINQETLIRVTKGLLRRCSNHVNLISVGMNESGDEERGTLLVAVQTILRGLSSDPEVKNV